MGCANGKGKPSVVVSSPSGEGFLDVNGNAEAAAHPTLLAGRGSGLLKVSSSLAQKGSSLAQRGSSSLLEGGAGLVTKGTGLLSKADPRRLAGKGSGSSEYLAVDVEAGEPEDPPVESKEHSKCKCLLWCSAALTWAAMMSAASFFWYVGVLPAIFGSTVSIIILVLVASPVLVPVVKCLFPFVQRKIGEMRGTNCYMWCCFVAMWGALALLFKIMWDLGVMQVVIGVMMSQVITVVLILLLVIPCLMYTLPIIKQKIFEIPGRVKAKLWEIPPLILPLFENMIKGLLQQMEERILEKLKDMPKDVAKAVTSVGGAAGDLGKKGFTKARSLTKTNSTKSKSSGDMDGSDSEGSAA